MLFSCLKENNYINYYVMSRGFVKEDDQEEVPLVPQRAYLPSGVTNFVTPAGMNQLLAEKQSLVDERNNLTGTHESEKRIAINYINAKLQLLNERINSAQIVNPNQQPSNEIRFGALVNLKTEKSENAQIFQIVGVDEANISKGKVSFLSPIARLLTNKKKGDKITIKQAGEDTVFEITDISYSR